MWVTPRGETPSVRCKQQQAIAQSSPAILILLLAAIQCTSQVCF